MHEYKDTITNLHPCHFFRQAACEYLSDVCFLQIVCVLSRMSTNIRVHMSCLRALSYTNNAYVHLNFLQTQCPLCKIGVLLTAICTNTHTYTPIHDKRTHIMLTCISISSKLSVPCAKSASSSLLSALLSQSSSATLREEPPVRAPNGLSDVNVDRSVSVVLLRKTCQEMRLSTCMCVCVCVFLWVDVYV
jgi:hypothetical protein